jgi:cephalosporin-C deacetylase-like acetyl esterase
MDQIGFGTRVLDAQNFYKRFPQWSLMGKMVVDVTSAIDSVSTFEMVDSSRIYIAGYGLGAKVGLFTVSHPK